MPSNVLTGNIKIVAPGAAATFNGVAEGAKKTQAAIVKLNPGVSKLGENLETLRAKALVRQSLINTETDVRKIAEMNRELKVLQGEIARVESIGTSGFGAAGKAATGFLGHLRNIAYVLPGIGIAGLLGGLSEMVVGLFKGADAFSEIEIEAGKFDNAMKKLTDRLEDFKGSLDFSEKLKNISLELSGLSGSALAAGKSGNAFLTNIKYASELSKEIADLSKKREAFFNQRLESEKQIQAVFGKSTKLADAFAIFGSVENIPEGIAEKLSNADKEFVREYKAATEKIKALSKERNEAIQGSVLNVGDIALSFKKDNVREKISRSIKKELLPALGSIQLELDPILSTKGPALSKIKESVLRIQEILNASPDFKGLEVPIKAFQNLQAGTNKGIELIKQKEIDRLRGLADTISGVLTPAFQGFFDTVKGGGNAFKAFANAAGQALIALIEKLAIAAILSLILSSITGAGTAIGAASGKFSDIFKFLSGFGGARASGGPVSAGKNYLVGENGPEMFRPNTGGYIVPHDQLGGGSGISGGISVSGVVTNILRGKDLVQLIALQTQSNNRLI